MILKFQLVPRTLKFRFDAGTSRGVLKTRNIWWIKAVNSKDSRIGWGEAAPLVRLSVDDRPDFEAKVQDFLNEFSTYDFPEEQESLLGFIKDIVPSDFPSLRFGLEMAIMDFLQDGEKRFFPNNFYDGQKPIPINGLIWMGDREFMREQIDAKISQGFTCIKMKIGAIDFEQELELLRYIRERFFEDELTLRVDANGAFSAMEAISKLERLAELGIHSIEQPIAAGQWAEMSKLCAKTPLPIALDEELIGIRDKGLLLDHIKPQHIILKPTLIGGFLESEEWIEEAKKRAIGWWMTSALESNIGLNAIAQLASKFNPMVPQGLGTGQLYHNNLNSPLVISAGHIRYQKDLSWEEPH